MLNSFILEVKRRETPFYEKTYHILKGILRFSVPSVKVIHLPLYKLHVFSVEMIKKIYQGVWVVPLFVARCKSCGKGLRLTNGMPCIIGDHLELIIGENVSILDSTLATGHIYDNPKIILGDRVNLGYHSDISAAKLVEIGDDTIIAKDCFIADNDGHPISPERRKLHESVNEDEIKPVHIGKNVWIGTGCMILKGVTIGDNSIIAANSVVTKSVPSNTIVAGNPAKIIKSI